MLLNDRSGICCDKCHTIHKTEFTYYSYDCYLKPGNGLTKSFDICSSCDEQTRNLVIAVNKKPPTRGRIRSDITGNPVAGYYLVSVTKAAVSGSNVVLDKQNYEFNAELEYIDALKPGLSEWSTNV